MDEKLYQNYFFALLNGDRKTCHDIIQSLLASEMDIREIYLDFFQRSLYEIGELWETNKVSVGTEHLATAITEGLLAELYPRLFKTEHIGKKALVSCAVNEYHQIGGKIVADIFELNGWDTHFLGANTPTNDLLQFIQDKKPDVVALSLSIYFNLPKLKQTAEAIRGNFEHQNIIFGGQAFRWGGSDKILSTTGTQYIESITELEKDLTK